MIEIWMEADRYWFFLIAIGFFLGRWYNGRKYQEASEVFKKAYTGLKEYQEVLKVRDEELRTGIKDLQNLEARLHAFHEKPNG